MRSYGAGTDPELEYALLRFADVVRSIPLGDGDFRAAHAVDPVRACQTCGGSDIVVVTFRGELTCARCLHGLWTGGTVPAPAVGRPAGAGRNGGRRFAST